MPKLRKSHKTALKTYRLLGAFLSPGMNDMGQKSKLKLKPHSLWFIWYTTLDDMTNGHEMAFWSKGTN